MASSTMTQIARPARGIPREALVAAGVAATLAAALAWLGPPGSDFAAHLYQSDLFEDHGFGIWNNFWYAGRYSFVTYSLLYYPLAALLGIKLLAVASIATAALAFGVVASREWGPAVALVEPLLRRRLGRRRALRRVPVRARHRAGAARALGAAGRPPRAASRC